MTGVLLQTRVVDFHVCRAGHSPVQPSGDPEVCRPVAYNDLESMKGKLQAKEPTTFIPSMVLISPRALLAQGPLDGVANR